jgi:hypothetical protein
MTQIVIPETPITGFDISDYAISNGLGDPVAGTFAFVTPDSS